MSKLNWKVGLGVLGAAGLVAFIAYLIRSDHEDEVEAPNAKPAKEYAEDGFDQNGYNCNGFNRQGYDRKGYDWWGYDCNGYNQVDVDRAGHDQMYYQKQITRLRVRLDEAFTRMENADLRYAVYDARVVMDEALRMIVQHTEGVAETTNDSLLNKLKICENKHLLNDEDFLDRLHAVRKICNVNGHEVYTDNYLTHDKAHFVVMQIRDLIDTAEGILIPGGLSDDEAERVESEE